MNPDEVDWTTDLARTFVLDRFELGNRVVKHLRNENWKDEDPVRQEGVRLWQVKKRLKKAALASVARWWISNVGGYRQLHINSEYEARLMAYGEPGPGWEVRDELESMARSPQPGSVPVLAELRPRRDIPTAAGV